MEEKKTESQKCSRCKVDYSIDNYNRKRNGVLLKTCKRCLENRKQYMNESKCIHKKSPNLCTSCNGISICKHNLRKTYCKQCGGGAICIHNRQRHICKKCNEPIYITIKTMIADSKNKDKQKNRYDQTNFIDYCFVENLIDDCEDKCYYCKCELQYVEYEANLATIERLDNSIGHIKGNCVIACRTCNYSKVGDKK